MAASQGSSPTLITSARIPKSLDADERNKRYLITMAFRVTFFLAGCFAPLPWNLAFFAGAALLPGFAVILANAIDKRPEAMPEHEPEMTEAPALTTGLVVRGEIEESEAE